MIFTIIQTAKPPDPYRYLNWLLKTANSADLKDPDRFQALLALECPG